MVTSWRRPVTTSRWHTWHTSNVELGAHPGSTALRPTVRLDGREIGRRAASVQSDASEPIARACRLAWRRKSAESRWFRRGQRWATTCQTSGKHAVSQRTASPRQWATALSGQRADWHQGYPPPGVDRSGDRWRRRRPPLATNAPRHGTTPQRGSGALWVPGGWLPGVGGESRSAWRWGRLAGLAGLGLERALGGRAGLGAPGLDCSGAGAERGAAGPWHGRPPAPEPGSRDTLACGVAKLADRCRLSPTVIR